MGQREYYLNVVAIFMRIYIDNYLHNIILILCIGISTYTHKIKALVLMKYEFLDLSSQHQSLTASGLPQGTAFSIYIQIRDE
ncbi:hypothetical protein ACJIZ3_023903 [Penstemon smallii]|uniref:Reverse transcriptase domain-containing protein n=1 Tax=Penstemon smallii TaxID=265156 RepID=A0ABD3TQC5_9LAMI